MPFSLIALTETKIGYDDDYNTLNKVDLLGYTFVSQPTASNAGGVGFLLEMILHFLLH